MDRICWALNVQFLLTFYSLFNDIPFWFTCDYTERFSWILENDEYYV